LLDRLLQGQAGALLEISAVTVGGAVASADSLPYLSRTRPLGPGGSVRPSRRGASESASVTYPRDCHIGETKFIPGGYIPALSEVMAAIEKAGLLVCDMEILRLHYAETLKAWRDAFTTIGSRGCGSFIWRRRSDQASSRFHTGWTLTGHAADMAKLKGMSGDVTFFRLPRDATA
jgi:cyclopropane fatty-acyl-phospholipid synthase-like methyltransferase